MTRASILAVALAALAACTSTKVEPPGLALRQPTAVAVFHGRTSPSGDPARPYLAVASPGGNDLTLVDATTDAAVLAPVPLHVLVIPVPDRPALVVSSTAGDGKPDLLVAVSAGDSRLQLVDTWSGAPAVVQDVDLGADVLALAPLFDPAEAGTVRVAAALAGEQVAIVTFSRAAAAGGLALVGGAPSFSGALGFQPLDLATVPGDGAALYAATREPIGGISGVARIDVAGGVPGAVTALDARAPTRLVAAADLAEAALDATAVDSTAFPSPGTRSRRVFAILDPSGCGPGAAIACGLVELAGTALAADDPTPAGTFHAPFRAPIPVPAGEALALAIATPPAAAEDPQYAGTFMRLWPGSGARATTATAAIASNDGHVYFVDLGRWELPSDQSVTASVKASPAPSTVTVQTGYTQTAIQQWIVLQDPGSLGTVSHLDPAGLASAVTVTPGFTSTATWRVTYQGALPGLSSRRAQTGALGGGAAWLALQVDPALAGTFGEVVRLYDPALGVKADPAADDVVSIDPQSLGTCPTFEARITALLAPGASYPGGAVQIEKDPAHPEWDACFDRVQAGTSALRATILAGGYVLTRTEGAGAGAVTVHAGRPRVGVPFAVAWQDEATLESACLLPPAKPWPPSAADAAACAPGSACRDACELLLRARLARRVGYVREACAATDARCLQRWPAPLQATGPALGFTLALETALAPPRDLALAIPTDEGRRPFQATTPSGVATGAGPIAVFDRSPWSPNAGVRFLVPFAGGFVLDTSPTLSGAAEVSIH